MKKKKAMIKSTLKLKATTPTVALPKKTKLRNQQVKKLMNLWLNLAFTKDLDMDRALSMI